jgi:hypothetical protein
MILATAELVGMRPLQGILAIDVIISLFTILPLLFIRIPLPERIEHGKVLTEARATFWQDFKAGLD